MFDETQCPLRISGVTWILPSEVGRRYKTVSGNPLFGSPGMTHRGRDVGTDKWLLRHSENSEGKVAAAKRNRSCRTTQTDALDIIRLPGWFPGKKTNPQLCHALKDHGWHMQQEPATPPKTCRDHIDLSAVAADPLLLGVWFCRPRG